MLESNNSEFISLPTFHKDGNDITKIKQSDIPLLHVRNGTLRTYEEKGSKLEDKTMIIYGTHKHYIAMSISDLKSYLTKKLDFKYY